MAGNDYEVFITRSLNKTI